MMVKKTPHNVKPKRPEDAFNGSMRSYCSNNRPLSEKVLKAAEIIMNCIEKLSFVHELVLL